MMENGTSSGQFITKKSSILLAQIALFAAIFLIWAALSTMQVGGPDALPGPVPVLTELILVLGTSTGWSAILTTFKSWALGLTVSIIVGVIVGSLLGLSHFTYRSTRGLFDFARSVPPIALLPMGVFIIGTSWKLPVTMIIWTCMWPIVLQTMYGVRDVDPVARDAMRLLRLNRWHQAIWLVGPSAMPYIMTGIRISAVMSLVVSIGTELIVGLPGIGYGLYYSQYSGAIPRMYAYVVIAAIFGSAVTLIFTRLEKIMLSWHPSHREQS